MPSFATKSPLALYEWWRDCRAFRLDPPATIGVDPASWLGWQVRRCIRSWGEWVDGRLEEREPEQVKALSNPPKGKVWSTRPRYRTIWDAMGMPGRKPETTDARLSAEANRLANQLAEQGGDVDWERPETWGRNPTGEYPA